VELLISQSKQICIVSCIASESEAQTVFIADVFARLRNPISGPLIQVRMQFNVETVTSSVMLYRWRRPYLRP